MDRLESMSILVTAADAGACDQGIERLRIGQRGIAEDEFGDARKQIFDFSHFLGDARSGESIQQRKRLFEDLFDHNRNFYVVDSTHLYFVSHDTLYYYNGRGLQLLSAVSSRPWTR